MGSVEVKRDYRWLKSKWITTFLIGVLSTVLFVAVHTTKAQKTDTYLGTWKATRVVDEFQSRVFFDIEKKPNDSLTGSFNFPARRFNDIPIDNISITGDSLSFSLRVTPLSFHGVIDKNENTIRGTIGAMKNLRFTPLKVPMDSARFDHPFTEPFTGITNNGTLNKNLFTIKKTGVSTKPIVEAANKFLATLSPAQRQKSTFAVDSDEWRHWTNSPFLNRRGVVLAAMTERQRKAAFSLMKAGLSSKGVKLSRDIMHVDKFLKTLTGTPQLFGKYHMTIMGQPSQKEPWGWQLDGHHLVINYFVLGDQVVMTPSFFGSEPAVIDTGRYAGTKVLQKEQNRGLALMQSFNNQQQEIAQIGDGTTKTKQQLQSAPFRDNVQIEYKGVKASQLTTSQQDSLLNLVNLYVSNIEEGHARLRMEEIKEHFDETHFAWIGKTDSDAVFYYRIQSPVILIEFDHAIPRSIPNTTNEGPYRDHIHTVVRTPNGNDYGKNLLKQHYEKNHTNNFNDSHHHK